MSARTRTYRVCVPCDECADDLGVVYDPRCLACHAGWVWRDDLDADDIVSLPHPVALRVLAQLSARDRACVLAESLTVVVDGRLLPAPTVECSDCDGHGHGSWPGDAWYESYDEQCEACGGRGQVAA